MKSQPLGSPPATASQVPDTGKLVPKYDLAALSDGAKQGKTIAQDNKVIEGLAEAMGAVYKLPKDIPMVGMECGGFNAYWDPQEDAMTLCYEMIAVAEDYGPHAEGDPTTSTCTSTP
jgi:Putative metallopeptidase